MKEGKSLVELAQELQRQKKAHEDFLVRSQQLAMVTERDNGEPVPALTAVGMDSYPLTNHCHGQVATHLKIPREYYNRMRNDSPQLLAENVNHWLSARKDDEIRMVRTLDGYARALVSNSYRRTLSNFDIALSESKHHPGQTTGKRFLQAVLRWTASCQNLAIDEER